jgi:hypothetical protein
MPRGSSSRQRVTPATAHGPRPIHGGDAVYPTDLAAAAASDDEFDLSDHSDDDAGEDRGDDDFFDSDDNDDDDDSDYADDGAHQASSSSSYSSSSQATQLQPSAAAPVTSADGASSQWQPTQQATVSWAAVMRRRNLAARAGNRLRVISSSTWMKHLHKMVANIAQLTELTPQHGAFFLESILQDHVEAFTQYMQRQASLGWR